MMKKLGYKKEFAGAVEAAASTGGQLMPPIMGAAAFLMVEFIGRGITYWEIAKAAIIPAILYFSGIWIMTHFEAKKLGLRGLTDEEIPNRKEIFKKIYLLNSDSINYRINDDWNSGYSCSFIRYSILYY